MAKCSILNLNQWKTFDQHRNYSNTSCFFPSSQRTNVYALSLGELLSLFFFFYKSTALCFWLSSTRAIRWLAKHETSGKKNLIWRSVMLKTFRSLYRLRFGLQNTFPLCYGAEERGMCSFGVAEENWAGLTTLHGISVQQAQCCQLTTRSKGLCGRINSFYCIAGF